MSHAKHHRSSADFEKLYIFGAGGSGREVAWLAEQTFGAKVQLAFVVDQPRYVTGPVNDLQIKLLSDIVVDDGCRFLIAIGDSILRRRATNACISMGLLPTSLVHPRAEVSPWVTFGEGVVVYPGAVLTTNVVISHYAQINVGCTISHDVVIGSYTTISPGAHISGHVQIGDDVFVGTGASVINGRAERPLVIGNRAVIAAGSCVTHPVESETLVAGVPAVRKR